MEEQKIETNPRKLTVTENAILTVKVLAIAATILGTLWGLNQLTAR